MARVVASIEARMTASRLPGKVLADIAGAPTLTRIARRLRYSARLDDIVLATTENRADDRLAEWASGEGVPYYRGSEEDVLGRVVEAHRMMTSEIVVEVCGDTPLIDASVIDRAVEAFHEQDCDIVSNTWTLTYPQGIDAQVFRLADLEDISHSVNDGTAREHVSLYFYEHPESYRLYELMAPLELRDPEQRLQVDFPEDLELVREIYTRLEPLHGDGFGVGEILDLLRQQPALRDINRHCREKAVR
ncbi:MAG: glycosyltransferase family protein [Pseudomonadota bacterium]|nr:glycosyltransferase family protein [Pseudomonadota bacterium]